MAGRPRRLMQHARVKQASHYAQYLAIRTLAAVLGMLSLRGTRLFASCLGGLLMRAPARTVRRNVAEENLRASFPDWSDDQVRTCLRGMYEHLARMLAEFVQFPRQVTLQNCREVMVFRNRKASVKALCSGRPVLMLGGHFGNWEASMAAFGVFGFPMGVVARQLDNPYVEAWLDAERRKSGHRLYWKRGGYDGMLELLEAGGNLALLCDQDAGKRGVFANFFGRPASTIKSLALLALEHDAIIVVGYGRRLPDDPAARWARFEIGCEAVIDARDYAERSDAIVAITEGYTTALERAVRRSPEQYFWLHRRWKTAPRVRKARRDHAKAA